MSIVSFWFIPFLIAVLLLYYLLPKRFQWGWLLVCSIAFLIWCSGGKRLPFVIFVIAVTYAGARIIAGSQNRLTRKIVLALTICFPILLLLGLKVFDKYVIALCNIVLSRIGIAKTLIYGDSILAPIGISYFTLTAIGYVLDVYWEKCEVQPNILKHSLFICYFPMLASGPIVNCSQMSEQLYCQRRFNYNDLVFGFERLLWGYLKKLVIADRLAIIVATVFADTSVYPGFYIIFATI